MHVIASFFWISFSLSSLSGQQELSVVPKMNLEVATFRQHREQIERDLRIITYKKYAILLGACALAAGVTYGWMRQPTGALEVPRVVPVSSGQVQAISREQRDAKLDYIIQHMVQRSVEPTTVLGRVKQFGKSCLDQGGVLILAQIVAGSFGPLMKYFELFDEKMSSFFGTYFFTADLPWFIQHRADAKSVFDDLCRYAALYDGNYTAAQEYAARSATDKHDTCLSVTVGQSGSNLDSARRYYYESVVRSWNICALQLEALIGFMQYKSEVTLILRYRERIATSIAQLEKRYAFYAALLAQHDSSQTNESLLSLVKAWRVELEQELVSFVQLERISLL